MYCDFFFDLLDSCLKFNIAGLALAQLNIVMRG